MKQPQKVNALVRPAMEVYDRNWRYLGKVEDRGTKASMLLARKQFGPGCRILPALVGLD